MRVRILLIVASLLAVVSCKRTSVPQATETLFSPDGKLSMEFTLSEDGVPAYSLKYADTPVVLPSELGYTLRGLYKSAHPSGEASVKDFGPDGDLTRDFKLVEVSRDRFYETWQPVWGEERSIRNNYNELAVTLRREGMAPVHKKTDRARAISNKETFDVQMIIRFRLYDDGLGFRYEFPDQTDLSYFTIKEEETRFRMAEDYTAWWIPGDTDTQEYTYYECRLSEIPSEMDHATDYSDSHRFSRSGVQTSIQMKSDAGLYVNIHEAALVNYPAMHLDLDAAHLTFRSWLSPDAEGCKGRLQAPCTSPWRTVQVVNDARKVLASRLILNLNEPCALEDVSWIHPVKYIGVWWEMITGMSTWAYTWDLPAVELGVTDYSKVTPNGRHGANNDNVRRYIDFAAENGFDGVLVEGWNEGWEDWRSGQKEEVFDFVTPYPDFDLPALNEYAHSKGIRLIMHHETSSSTRNYERRLDDAFALMKRYGYDAVKNGYVGNIIPFGEGHYSQPMVNHYNYVLAKAAENHLMINMHESVRPTGLCRTWPNLIGNECAQGNEYRSRIRPHQVTVLPFTRLQGGPMDYTPGIFESNIRRLNPSSRDDYMQTTICRQLALYVTMYSPLQMAGDLPEHYSEHMDAFRFIRDVAVDWEQSLYLMAEPGDYIVIARQTRKDGVGASKYCSGSGDVWFVGGVTDENAREVSIPLDFLQAGAKYEAIIYRDAPDADGVAGIQPDGSNPGQRYVVENQTVDSGGSLSVWMARSGGFAVSLKKI